MRIDEADGPRIGSQESGPKSYAGKYVMARFQSLS